MRLHRSSCQRVVHELLHRLALHITEKRPLKVRGTQCPCEWCAFVLFAPGSSSCQRMLHRLALHNTEKRPLKVKFRQHEHLDCMVLETHYFARVCAAVTLLVRQD